MFRHILRKFLAVSGFADLLAEQFAPDAARRYRRDQIRGTLKQSQVLLLGNSFIAPVFAYQGLPDGPALLLGGWALAMILSTWILFFWTQPLRLTNGDAADMRRIELRAMIDGGMWVAGMACIYPNAMGDSKVIVGIIITGAVALGTFGYSRAAIPALMFLSLTALGSGLVALVTGLTTGSPADQLVMILAFFAFVALIQAVKDQGKGELRSFKNYEKLSEKTEVVELLLKDYEAQATEWLWRADARGNLTVVPDVIEKMLGGREAFLEGRPILRILGEKHTSESGSAFDRMARAVYAKEEFHDVILSFPDTEPGGLRWVAVKGRPQFDDGVFQGYRGIAADTTQAVLAEQQVQRLATYDSLTGLLNRNSVHQRLGELDPDMDKVIVCLIDLDGFKQINDSYGHDVGDDLLKATAERLKTVSGGRGWSARLAGDEFLTVVPQNGATEGSSVLTLGKAICDILSEPVSVGSFELQISASVGIARFPVDTVNGHDLLSICDLALYTAKAEGRDRPVLFDHSMLERQNERVATIERLKRAIQNRQIELYYQPRHTLRDGRLIGFEALARWNDDYLGAIPPDRFIPIAEQTGLIVELGEQLLRLACEQAMSWYREYGRLAPVVSVNISPVQFARTDVAALIEQVLEDVGLPPELIEVEVTEGVLISDKARVANTLKELYSLGVSIALDDFGTGYSSLSYLRALPLSRLKIDRSFVGDLALEEDAPIVSTIIQLGKNLDLRVLAEGIETRAQMDRLLDLGCDEGQGYFLARPLPVVQADHYARQELGAPRRDKAV